MTGNSWMLLWGVALALLGVLLRWRTSRYDLKDAALDSAWTLARGRRTAENPTALEGKLHEIQAQATWRGKATKTAGTVAGHFLSQVAAVVALALMVAGAGLVLAGLLWK